MLYRQGTLLGMKWHILDLFHPKELLPIVFGKRMIKTSDIVKKFNTWAKLDDFFYKQEEHAIMLFFLKYSF